MSEASLSNSAGSARDDGIMTRSSSVRKHAAATLRPTPPNTDDDDLKVMGIKEIEKTIEKLKKQNWDLKLELYHRRERQAMLEELAKTSQERAKILQDEHASIIAQQAETMRLNDDLAQELDKRDKALFEAIDMIVDLQTTVAELEREKAMVRIVEADLHGPAISGQVDNFDRSTNARPYQPNSSGLPLTTDFSSRLGDPKTLERMSSFLSERGERTANLRDMILHNKSSFFHSRKISEASTIQSEFNRSVSPGVSLLSESSFLSVYGMNKRTPDQMLSPPEPEEPLVMQSIETPGPRRNTRNFSDGSRASSIITPLAWADSQTKFLDIRSPLQQLERLDGKLSVEGGSRPTTSSAARSAHPPVSQRQRAQIKTNQEKRDSLRRVVTSSPNADDLANAHMLPPTPDTTSSSMLRRHQNSHETLSEKSSITPRESIAHEIHMTPVTALPPQISTSSAQGDFSRPLSKLATTERPSFLGAPLPEEEASRTQQLVRTASQRPRSADETTISRHLANSWDSDSDSEGGADAYSEANDMDYWIREGAKPNPKSTAPRSTSPDLFSFPTESGRWETDVIFGAMRGTGFMGSPAPGLKRDPMDQLSSSPLIAPEDGVYYPPEPDAPDGGISAPQRQSSRSARTSSMTGSENTLEPVKARKGPVRWSDSTRGSGRTRSSSIDSAALSSSVNGPTKYLGDGSGALKRTNHPPLAGQPARQKKPSTLNRLFRRSLGGSQDQAEEDQEQRTPTGQAHARPRRSIHSGRSSVPPPATTPWRAPAAVLESDLTSATPPPIMRSRGHRPDFELHKSGDKLQTPRSSRVVSPSLLHQVTSETDNEMDTPQSGRRKWLSLGRRNSLRGRN
ncbi:hypothetical protein PFICI_08425 [Pestalotiopsis fici W106-1]|uniref:Centrosomin N-terminal motif 1 domain-containing protein n=1 Tax=Pestalotiopsis fici (strain W106-1 / CGMCC3.15140) TaxID=1229662 RepID=W3X6T5_PESFW|nr:uncharacterized protein PFICI_08425 [Pestalotiopsis fici W106-1]ETS80896.1 hypothetical protein PFICI_08425 [Pestalotiopsis fici W106-1]